MNEWMNEWINEQFFFLGNLNISSEDESRTPVSQALYHNHYAGQMFFILLQRRRLNIVGSLRDREVACSASDRKVSNFESCIWRAVSSHSSHHLQEIILAQFY